MLTISHCNNLNTLYSHMSHREYLLHLSSLNINGMDKILESPFTPTVIQFNCITTTLNQHL